MSDLGGAMGMTIGASFLTAVEFIELLTDLILLMVVKVTKTEKQVHNTNKNLSRLDSEL